MIRILRIPIDAVWRNISGRIDRAPVSTEQKHRLLHYTVFIILGLPTLIGFGIYSVFEGQPTISVLVAMSSAGLIGGWFALMRLRNGQDVHRINAAIYTGMLLYMVVIGGDEGSKILWMYTYPLFIFFLLGTREGLVWSLGCLLALGPIIEDPFGWFSTYAYGTQFKVRFIASFALVSMIAFWFQYLRHRYFVSMEDKQARLQAALDQVKTLKGLIPICANCHKIRDDEGFWDQMESYIARHSDAQFSHGICPDCMNRLYPEFRRAANGD